MKPKKSFKPFQEFIGKHSSVIVDLGAWNGQFSDFFSTISDRVIAVEPDPRNLDMMRQRFIDKKNIKIVAGAISDKVGTELMYMASKSWQNSLYNKKGWKIKDEHKTSVPTITWDYLVDLCKLDKVDFVKVNIEGAEEALLRGMTKVFPDKMVIEAHDRQRVCDRDNLKRLLAEKGFRVVKEVDYDDIYIERCSQ